MEKQRVEMLSDGVFAIVITLLVLDIKLSPTHEINSDSELRQALITVLPNMMAYVLSFCIIGVFWAAHHTIFSFVKAVDNKILWLNIFYLLVVTFIPFPTSLLAEHHDKQSAVILYSLTLGLAGFFHFILLEYLNRHKNLTTNLFTAQVKKQTLFPSLFGPLAYLLSIGLSFISLFLSFALLLVIPVYYIFFRGTFGSRKKGSRH